MRDRVAIVGMACRLPGADNLEQFWELLASGRSAIAEVPPARLDQSLYYDPNPGVPGKTYTKLAGTVSPTVPTATVDGLPQNLVATSDPAHLALCQVAQDACRHAKIDPTGARAGVFVGYDEASGLLSDLLFAEAAAHALTTLYACSSFLDLPAKHRESIVRNSCGAIHGEYQQYSHRGKQLHPSMAAGLISQALGVSGPSFVINSACASSLLALLAGVRALEFGDADLAIVGGAATLRFDTLVEFSKAGANSATGSRPFDTDADGVICSEGYAAVVLKPLSRAAADGNAILAVVDGLGISCDGRGKGMWAPSSHGQTKAIVRAYGHGRPLADVQYIEAHATSTPLGDATELQSLQQVLGESSSPSQQIVISSVKANIGHTLEAAGLASVIKTVLCMQHGFIPPAINVRAEKSAIDNLQGPLRLPTTGMNWPTPAAGQSPRAAVNAFGLGGLNMHVVLGQRAASQHQNTAGPGNAPDKVAIVGRGCIFPGARDFAEFRKTIELDRRSAEFFDFNYDWRRHKIPPRQITQGDPLHFLLLEAVDQAMSEVTGTPIDTETMAAIVGIEFVGDFTWQWQLGLRLPYLRKVLRTQLAGHALLPDLVNAIDNEFSEQIPKHWPALLDDTGSFHHSSPASRIAKAWNFMGGATTIDCGAASALASLWLAVRMLLAGDCDTVVCTAGYRRPRVRGCEELLRGATANQSPTEGAGAIVLRRRSDAEREGQWIWAVIEDVSTAATSTGDDSGAADAMAALMTLLVQIENGQQSGIVASSCNEIRYAASLRAQVTSSA